MDEIFVAYCRAAGAQFGDDALDLQRVPQNNGVGEQTEATGLVHDHLEVRGAELALVSEEQPSGQAMTGLATVKLGLDAQAERLVM
jgi:hypothetical protein